jgi:hypothetical protein
VKVAVAGVPQPDVIFYGKVTINGQTITASDNVSVIARVSGVPDPVGRYRMGDGGTAGDNYVLRIRLEAPVPGSPVGSNVAQVGQTVQLYIKQGANELLAHSAAVTTIGVLRRQDLSVSVLPANCVVDAAVDLADHQAFNGCMAGPGAPVAPGCSCADVDGDGHVDLRDWRWFQSGFSG